MQVFRELVIHGKPEQLHATVETICNSVSGNWSRDMESEERIRNKALPNRGRTFSFKCTKRGDRPAADLFLMEKDDSSLYVTNIVPQEHGQLSYAEFNAILEEFATLFVWPAAERTGSRVEMTEAEADLESWVSPETAKKLRLFCWSANKSTGSAHPADRKRWFDFIVSAHREGSLLDSTTLRRWLHESAGWDENGSHELASEYEFARELLTQGTREAVGA